MVELKRLSESQMTFLRWLTFLLGSLTVTLRALIFIYFFWPQYLFFNGFPSNGKFWLFSLKLKWGYLFSLHSLWLFFCWLEWSSCIWEMFHGRISLNLVLLRLVVDFVSGPRVKLMYIPIIINVRWTLIYLYGFWLLVQHPYLIEVPSETKLKFKQAFIKGFCKRVLEAVELAYAN